PVTYPCSSPHPRHNPPHAGRASDDDVSEGTSMAASTTAEVSTGSEAKGLWRCFVFSGFGRLTFFVPITIGGVSSIPLDHLVTAIETYAAPVVPFVVLALIVLGTARPFITGSWRQGITKGVFSFLNILGLAVAVMMLTVQPGWLAAEGIGTFL